MFVLLQLTFAFWLVTCTCICSMYLINLENFKLNLSVFLLRRGGGHVTSAKTVYAKKILATATLYKPMQSEKNLNQLQFSRNNNHWIWIIWIRIIYIQHLRKSVQEKNPVERNSLLFQVLKKPHLETQRTICLSDKTQTNLIVDFLCDSQNIFDCDVANGL